MPGPIVAKPQLPWWMDPAKASVLDVPGQGLLRTVVGLLGLDDPNQIMAVGVPLETGAKATGGALDAIAKKFPRFVKAIKAYHGSPHDFERFDSAKIGTGEGAQAYGHGLYFAEQEGTAQSYKNVLGGREFDVQGRKLYSSRGGASKVIEGQSRAETIAADALDDAFNAQSTSPAQFAANRLRKAQQLYPEEGSHITDAMKVIADWQESGNSQRLQGKMYEVAIQADPEDFLDWDKPLSQQSEKVKAALAPKLQRLAAIANDDVKERILSGTAKGSDIHHWLAGEEHIASGFQTPPPVAAASAMKQAGIPGLKYYDSGSRTASGGFSSADRAGSDLTRNYVVFDDRLVEILKKYGIAAPVIEGLRQTAAANRGRVSQEQIEAVSQ